MSVGYLSGATGGEDEGRRGEWVMGSWVFCAMEEGQHWDENLS